MDGFSVEGGVARPAVDVEQETRELMLRVVAAISRGATPEDATRWMEGTFPAELEEYIEQPLVREEMSDHVDVLLAAMMTTGARVAA